MTQEGLVIRNTGSWYVVLTDCGRAFECKVKGNFRLKGIRSTNPVAVGDHVRITPGADGETALITEITDRRNYIIRRASNLSKQSHIIAANIDQAALLVTVSHPEVSTTFIDRFLASAEAYRVPVLLLFNKVDLCSGDELSYMDAVCRLYSSLDYTCLRLSAKEGAGLDEVRSHLQGKTTLLSGNSGVGKSTLLNALLPDAQARTAEISEAHQTGMHTTTFSQMFFLPQGGALIDTPGIKGFGTFDMERTEVAHYFREIFQVGQECRFDDCTHTHEPGCAVLQAVEEHRIAQSRYTSYLSMLEDKDEDSRQPHPFAREPQQRADSILMGTTGRGEPPQERRRDGRSKREMRKTQCAACDCAARCDGHCSALQWLMHRTAASCPAYIRMTRNAESRPPHHAPAGEAGPYSSPHNAVSISTRAAWEYPTGPLTRCPHLSHQPNPKQ